MLRYRRSIGDYRKVSQEETGGCQDPFYGGAISLTTVVGQCQSTADNRQLPEFLASQKPESYP